jgi:hypothetical protein
LKKRKFVLTVHCEPLFFLEFFSFLKETSFVLYKTTGVDMTQDIGTGLSNTYAQIAKLKSYLDTVDDNTYTITRSDKRAKQIGDDINRGKGFLGSISEALQAVSAEFERAGKDKATEGLYKGKIDQLGEEVRSLKTRLKVLESQTQTKLEVAELLQQTSSASPRSASTSLDDYIARNSMSATMPLSSLLALSKANDRVKSAGFEDPFTNFGVTSVRSQQPKQKPTQRNDSTSSSSSSSSSTKGSSSLPAGVNQRGRANTSFTSGATPLPKMDSDYDEPLPTFSFAQPTRGELEERQQKNRNDDFLSLAMTYVPGRQKPKAKDDDFNDLLSDQGRRSREVRYKDHKGSETQTTTSTSSSRRELVTNEEEDGETFSFSQPPSRRSRETERTDLTTDEPEQQEGFGQYTTTTSRSRQTRGGEENSYSGFTNFSLERSEMETFQGPPESSGLEGGPETQTGFNQNLSAMTSPLDILSTLMQSNPSQRQELYKAAGYAKNSECQDEREAIRIGSKEIHKSLGKLQRLILSDVMESSKE